MPRARPRGSRSPTTCRRRPCRCRPRSRASSRAPRWRARAAAPALRARCMSAERSSCVISPYSTVTIADAGQARDLRLHVGGDLAAERARRGRERDLDPDVAVRRDGDVLHHAEVDDADVAARDRGRPRGCRARRPTAEAGRQGRRVDGSTAAGQRESGHGNKNSVDLENMPDCGLPSSRDGHARGAQGTR